MKKLTIIFISLFILLLSSVSAVFTPTICWSFDETSGDLVDECSGLYNVTTIESAHKATVCKINGCQVYSHAGGTVDEALQNAAFDFSAGELSAGFWFNASSQPGAFNFWLIAPTSMTSTYMAMGMRDSGTATGRMDVLIGGGPGFFASTGVGNTSEWIHWVVTINDSKEIKHYINGQLDTTTALSYTMEDTIDIFFGGRTAAEGNTYDGLIDEPFVHVGIMTAAEVEEVFDRTTPWSGAPASTPSLTLFSSLVNNTMNYNLQTLNFTYNGTCFNCDSNIVNITFFQQGVSNKTLLDIDMATNNVYNITFPIGFEGFYNVSFNASGTGVNASSGVFIYNVDLVEPFINFTGPQNNSFVYRHIQNINVTTTGTDPNLFAGNMSLIRLSDSLVLNFTFLDSITTTSATLNLSIDPGDDARYENGRYETRIMWWDSHTKKEIKPYKLNKLNDGYEFEDSIIISSPDLNNMNLDKKKDRYEFDMDFNTQNPDIYLESDGDLTYIQDSEYKGHFVDFKNKKWIDFEDDDNTPIQITKVNNKKYKIVPQGTKKSFKFKSIGDLNENGRSFFFNITDGFTFYAQDHFTLAQIDDFTITVFNSTFSEQKTTTTGNITFNITQGSFTTNITAPLYAANETGNITFTFNSSFMYDMFLTNSLLLNFFNEDTDLLIVGPNISVDVINIDNESISTSTTTGTVFVSGFAEGRYTLEFIAPGFLQNTFFTTIVGSDTQEIDLYLVSNVTGTLIVFDISDEKGNPIKNATLKRSRFFIDDNAFLTTGMSITDSNGQTAQNLVPNDVFYKFLIEKDGLVIFTGDAQKIFSTLVFFRVSVLPDLLTSYNFVHNGDIVALPITWNNETNIVQFTWTETSNAGQFLEGCLRIIQRGNFNEVIHGPVCSSASAATVQLNMSAFRDNRSTFLAQGIIETDSQFSEPMLQQQSFNFNSDFEIFAGPGLFMAYIFIFSMFMVGVVISFSVGVMFTTISLIILNIVGISFFGWTLIIIVTVVGLISAVVIKN